jgi:hypothetical protein
VKFDTGGSVVWQNLDADGSQNLLLHAQMLMDSGNNAYLAAGVLTNMAACKVNSDGSSGWLSLAGMGSGTSAIALGRDGRIFATGGETVQLSQPWEPRPAAVEIRRDQGNPYVSLIGEPGRTYRLEVSDDFVRWRPACMMLLHGPKQSFHDTEAASEPRRFYRVATAD